MTRRRNLVVGWSLALLAIALFAGLGRWQARRAVEKQAMLDAAAQVLAQRRPGAFAAAKDDARAGGYDWAAGSGTFDPQTPLLLDNQQRFSRVGVRVYGIFRADDGTALLVDVGWLPVPPDRRMPSVNLPSGPQHLRGLLSPPPSSGIAIGPGIARQDDAWVLTRVEPAAIAQALGLQASLAPRVLRLDPTLPIGYERDTELLANTLPPEKHRGYSLQWFALAVAVLVIALILTFRKPRP